MIRSRPPAWAEKLLAGGMPPGPMRDSILGDLHEEFEERRSASGLSGRLAVAWYWVQAVRLRRHFSRSWLPPDGAAGPDAPRPEARMNRWNRDLRYAWRSLRRAPAFAGLVILTLGAGIGANVAIFSVVDGVLLTPLAYRDSDRLVAVWTESVESRRRPTPSADFEDLRHDADLMQVAGRWTNTGSLIGEFDPLEVSIGWVDPGYFDVLGVPVLYGRLFEEAGDDGAVVLSHGIWQRQYGGDPAIVGKFIRIDGDALEVVGVLPASPDPNVATNMRERESNDVWRVLRRDWYEGSDDRSLGWIRVTARLRDGVTVQQAQQQLESIALEARPIDPVTGRPERWYRIEPLLDDLVGAVRPTLLALLGAVGFVLLIASFNVAQLMLTRGRARAGELAIRTALGGSRGDLFRQLVLEALILSLSGGVLGVVIGAAGVRSLLAMAPGNLPRIEGISVDARVLGYALVISSAVALIAGVVPALRAATRGPVDALKARGSSRGAGRRRLSGGLVIAEVALSLVLLAGAGLLARSFVSLARVEPGFQPEQVLTFSVTSPGNDAESPRNFFLEVRRDLLATPGIVAAGAANRFPLTGGVYSGFWAAESMDVESNDKPGSDFRWITPGYFGAMGARIVRGRDFDERDPREVVIVDEQLAATAWPRDDPVGKRLWTGRLGLRGEWAEVVGVVESIKHTSMADVAAPTIYFNTVRPIQNQMYFAVRAEGSPLAIVDVVSEIIRRVDADATISRLSTMDRLVADANAPWRFALLLMSLFAAVALLITVVGLFGVIAYAVSARTREIGIRVALGAPRASVLWLVLGRSAAMISIGALIGVAGSLALSSVLSSLLFGVEATDPLTYTGVVVFMMLASMLGAWRPTRRALRIDPREALARE